MVQPSEPATRLAAFDAAADGWMVCEAVRDPVGQVDDFAFTYVNAAAAAALGSTREAMLARTQRRLFPMMTANGLFEASLDVVANRRVCSRSIWYESARLSCYYKLTMTPYGDGFLTCLVSPTDSVLPHPGTAPAWSPTPSNGDAGTGADIGVGAAAADGQDTVEVYLLVNPLRDS